MSKQPKVLDKVPKVSSRQVEFGRKLVSISKVARKGSQKPNSMT